MALHNFARPPLPYVNEPRPNDNRFAVLTNGIKPVPVFMLEGEHNYFIDIANQLDRDINNVTAGSIPGSDNPNNAGLFLTTDGAAQPTLSFVALSASLFPDGTIPGIKLVDQSVTMQQLGNNSVGADHIQNFAITGIKIENSSVHGGKLVDNSVSGSKLIGSAITTEKIANNAVTTAKIPDGAITTLKIFDNAVTTAKIPDNAITTPKILDNAVTTAKIPDNAITTPKIPAKAVTAEKIADNTITFNQISNSFAATKSQQQAATSASTFVSPSTQQYHPSAASFWCYFNGTTSGTNAPLAGYNVASVTRTSAGNYTINFIQNFSTSNYCIVPASGTTTLSSPTIISLSPSSCRFSIVTPFGGGVDQPIVCVFGFGVQ